ncbi:amidohydrolase family protein [Ramlibacter sp.]|uniref:amidohydrolase family protein n=1 Tax=Ramlibacter sp. TaxID=1917967 RepID=UPI0026241B8E|nr:amidohydrolase family protein [Ramlibacter sp.]MDB5955839.1 amidohydrolase [Ramlibacter sp.]
MFYTCSPDCTDPLHQHGARRSAHLKAAPVARATATKTIARSRSGKTKVVDLHCHYLNPEVNAKTAHLNAAQYDPTVIFADDLTRETNVKQMKTRAVKLTGVDQRLKDMDRMGVDVQAVCPAPYHFFYFTEADYGAELARQVNEGIAKIVADTPDRFVGLGSVPLQNAELAVRELDYAVKNLGLRGVEICTNVNGKNLTDPELGLEKFFARCEELGIVIFMHPLGYTQADRLTHHYFNNVIGNPLESTVAVSHLIFDGVMARHPKLKIVVAHGGGFVAHYWARMDHAWRARPDCRTVIKRPPSKYLEKFYFDSITFDPLMLKHLIDRFGADHVVLGTDYPYDMGEEDPLGLIAQVKRLPKADRELIAGGNAAKLLKLKF